MLNNPKSISKGPGPRDLGDRRVRTRRSEDYFWLLRVSEITGDCCLVVDGQMQIEFIDPRLLNMLDITAEIAESITNFSDLAQNMAEKGCFGQGDPKVFQALMWDLLTNQKLKQSRTSEVISGVTPSGNRIDITVTYGRDDRFILLFSDKTDEWIEDQILKTAMRSGDSGYWHYNIETDEFFAQVQSLKALLTPEMYKRVQTENLSAILHPDDHGLSKRTMRAATTTGEAQSSTFRIVDKHGAHHWLRAHLVPGVDERNRTRTLTGFFTNITEDLRVREDLVAAQKKAERALKTKNTFLSHMSHEVRTPMNAVIGLADAIIHHHDHPELRSKLSLIQSSAEKVIHLVDETLQHAKLEGDGVKLHPKEASPRKVAETVRDLWDSRAKKNQSSLTCSVSPDVPDTMVFDAFRFEQCLNNLVSNAVKFTDNGTIQIILAVQDDGAVPHLVMAVRDTGIGMNDAQIANVFEPFKQADESITSRYGGTGLGMSITKDLIELMGGRISVKSELGKGTLFVTAIPITSPASDDATIEPSADPAAISSDEISAAKPSPEPEQVPTPRPDAAIPATPMAQADPPESAEDRAASRYANLDILIVDDNATNHLVVGSLLDSVVGHIDTAMNGEEAIAALAAREDSNKAMYDLVLMDIHMPVMDGIEATLAIRSGQSGYSDVPIIALTADPQYQQSRLCKNIGMNEALAKPIKLKQLLAAFDTIMERNNTVIAA